MPPKTLRRPLAQRTAALELASLSPLDEPDIPSNVIQAASDALARGETHYTDRPGIPEFRTFVAEQLNNQYGLEIDPKEVTITCGSTEARFVTLTLLAELGASILCPGDTTPIQGAAHLVGAGLVQSFENENPEAIRILYLTPDDTEIDNLLEQAAKHHWWVIWDLSNFSRKLDFHPAQRTDLTDRVVTIDSISEHMSGWRIGWMAGSEAALRLRAFKQAITICTTNVSQWAGLEFVRTKES